MSTPAVRAPSRDLLAVAAGTIRMASGVSFLVVPGRASELWGSDPEDNPTASLLLRSMGYRDALVGLLLLRAGWQGSSTAAGWFLASAGADLSDLIGGLANHDRLPDRSRTVGLGGAVVGIGLGLLGAVRADRRNRARSG